MTDQLPTLPFEIELETRPILREAAMSEVRPGYKRTEVGVIPEDWQVAPISSVAQIERGKFTARPRNDPKYYGGHIPFIQTGDVSRSNGKIRAFSQTLNEYGLAVSKLFKQGTLFFTIAANIGDVGFADFDAACPDSLVAMTTKAENDVQWLACELGSRKASFEAIATSNAQLNINLEKLRPYLLPIPPPPEQRAISHALLQSDALIGGLEALIAKKRDIKQGAMQELLTGRRRLAGFQEPWERTLLGKLGAFQKGSGVRKDQASSGDLPCVRYGELYTHHNNVIKTFNSRISREVAGQALRLRVGDVLFAGSGETKEEIGKCASLVDDVEAYAGGDIVVLRPFDANPTFLGYLLNMQLVQRKPGVATLTTSLARRVRRLESESNRDREVTLEEWIVWSYRPKEWRRSDNSENLDFIRRFEKSELCRLIEKSVKG